MDHRWRKARPGSGNAFLHILTPITIVALLITLVLLFSFKGEVIVANPLTIVWIAIPLFLQTRVHLRSRVRARSLAAAFLCRCGASGDDRRIESLRSRDRHLGDALRAVFGAALATVVGVLIEVPVMLMLVEVCKRTAHWFPAAAASN
jgi:ACR3 family arsenite transporter